MNTTAPDPDDVPWLADDERAAWMTLISLLMSLPTAIDAQLKRDAGLNFFEYSILTALSRPPGRPVRMNTLALFAGGSASRLSHAVSRLERQGWVRREVQNPEVRCTEAMLTEKGLAALAAAAPDHVREARRLVFDAITPEQVAQLQQISRQLLEVAAPEVATALDRAIHEEAAVGGEALDVAMPADPRCAAPEHLCAAVTEPEGADAAGPARADAAEPERADVGEPERVEVAEPVRGDAAEHVQADVAQHVPTGGAAHVRAER
ncbi:MarR family winged helix-turn-helix transcriptional regulator [Actinoplanes sp. KI2]|uniref:MarR family winged helix-turn-helix transcriptional regulator n=1 Tax=Actinoplanes sp. KI2 TaxID=2983315 RepID=UPI0021D5DA02|nr:MarR family winged helix-turn-helix transcriptional regulator [Actinoplanes sp. KI2]MCU7728806.1 MarR family winged helix-turn-helix transcriptional regulator [Actinoplanes sp. KI2]